MTLGKNKYGQMVEVSWKVVMGFIVPTLFGIISVTWQLSQINGTIQASSIAIHEIKEELKAVVVKTAKFEELEKRVALLEQRRI